MGAVSTEKTRLFDKYTDGLVEAKQAIARKLLAKKTPLEEVAELTELSLAEIKALEE